MRTLYKTHKLLEAILAHYENMKLDPDFKGGLVLGLNTALALVDPRSDEVFENYWHVMIEEEEGRQ